MKGPPARRATAVLIGADGMLGRAMAEHLARRQWECIAPSREQLDLERPDSIRRFFDWTRDRHGDGPPNMIINCAAWTDVDGAEEHEPQAMRINAEAVNELASLCATDTVLLTFSTDYVFNGRAGRPYAPDHPREPLNAYGRSKAAGEALLEARPRHEWLNVRTSWLYAPWGKNFVLTMRQLLLERPRVSVVDDQRGRPTSAEHLARASLALVDAGARGHYHLCDGGECTWFEFAQEIKRLTAAPAEIVPCTSDAFPRAARRPAYSVLDLTRTEAILGPMPAWTDNLADVLLRVQSG